MNQNAANTLIGELHSASSYLERIFHALMDITPLGNTRDIKQCSAELYFELSSLFESSLFRNEFTNKSPSELSTRDIRAKIKASAELLQCLLKLDYNTEATATITVEFINLVYRFSYKLHMMALEKTSIDIQLPRMNLLTMEESFDPLAVEKNVAHFHLPYSKVSELAECNNTSISSLDFGRDKKYETLIQKGHEAIYHAKNDDALAYFLKAIKYKKTAEVLTLIGWAYSLIKDSENAKTHCLKAIQLDEDYGPAYNDLGNYLLAEGQENEALKWFELAKKAPIYQNREYPYINAGRAYIMRKEYEKALEEFSAALAIAPFHDELHETVDRLKRALEKDNKIFDNLGPKLSNIEEDNPHI